MFNLLSEYLLRNNYFLYDLLQRKIIFLLVGRFRSLSQRDKLRHEIKQNLSSLLFGNYRKKKLLLINYVLMTFIYFSSIYSKNYTQFILYCYIFFGFGIIHLKRPQIITNRKR